MKKNKGFTLIELLVVIAIIGILAAIVLVSLAGARNKAIDARIQADLAQVRSSAELFYNDNSYRYNEPNGGYCNSTDYITLNADINSQKNQTVLCKHNAEVYCVSAITSNGSNTCVSSSGKVEAGKWCNDDYECEAQ